MSKDEQLAAIKEAQTALKKLDRTASSGKAQHHCAVCDELGHPCPIFKLQVGLADAYGFVYRGGPIG